MSLTTSGASSSASLINALAGGLVLVPRLPGSLTAVSTLGNLTQTGVLTVIGASSFTTSAPDATITLTSANLLTGAASLNTSGTGGNASLMTIARPCWSVERRRQPDGDGFAGTSLTQTEALDGRRHISRSRPRRPAPTSR